MRGDMRTMKRNVTELIRRVLLVGVGGFVLYFGSSRNTGEIDINGSTL
ncbi:hypothetical protein STSP2_00625 [Anaerohalosphaera lusitana]|uniref:Uncharacterized protein n=1 Tax=Anaerohalosphaera lusitana TaxID=1936003 RepID=A0A1U9NIA5_9BACT|nr:hypothetical protein STSP2_00625 [Anaerohalosphaera lusitana]